MSRCSYCNEPVSHSPRNGCQQVFCNRECRAASIRRYTPKAVRVKEKRLYDMEYRRKNRAMLKAKKAAYFQRTYDPVKAAKERKKRMHLHVAYCRRPEYRAKKRVYDQQRRDSEYGPFSEAARLTINLNREIKTRSTAYEIRIQNQTLNKRQSRARAEFAAARDRHSRAQG